MVLQGFFKICHGRAFAQIGGAGCQIGFRTQHKQGQPRPRRFAQRQQSFGQKRLMRHLADGQKFGGKDCLAQPAHARCANIIGRGEQMIGKARGQWLAKLRTRAAQRKDTHDGQMTCRHYCRIIFVAHIAARAVSPR